MRSMVKWEPLAALARLDSELDGIVRGLLPTDRGVATGGVIPAVDILDEGTDVVLRVELPGIDPDRDLDLAVERGRLVLRGRREPAIPVARSSEPAAEEGVAAPSRLTLSEIRHGAFHRTFILPDHVTGNDVEADYDRGILTIRIHDVVQPTPESRRITVTIAR